RAVRGAVFSLRRARHLVRGRRAGVSARRARLELCAGGRVHGVLGDRLRHRAGRGTRDSARQGPGGRHGGGHRVRAGGGGGGDTDRACGGRAGGRRDHRRAGGVRRGLSAELGGAFVFDFGLHGRRQGRVECRLLLHGKRRRASGRLPALGRALSGGGVGRVFVGRVCVRGGGGRGGVEIAPRGVARGQARGGFTAGRRRGVIRLRSSRAGSGEGGLLSLDIPSGDVAGYLFGFAGTMIKPD